SRRFGSAAMLPGFDNHDVPLDHSRMAIRLGAVVLVGLSGSGKSTVGPLVAERLGRQFDDIDRLIEGLCHETIPEFFKRVGEAEFRKAEAFCLDNRARSEDLVVAAGGGALTTWEGREAAARGFVAWL